jgi:hypothetical protein
MPARQVVKAVIVVGEREMLVLGSRRWGLTLKLAMTCTKGKAKNGCSTYKQLRLRRCFFANITYWVLPPAGYAPLGPSPQVALSPCRRPSFPQAPSSLYRRNGVPEFLWCALLWYQHSSGVGIFLVSVGRPPKTTVFDAVFGVGYLTNTVNTLFGSQVIEQRNERPFNSRRLAMSLQLVRFH